MKKIVSYFFSDFKLISQTKRFKQLLYLFVAIKCIYWLSYYDLYFGQNSISLVKPFSLGSIKHLAFLLYENPSTQLGYFFILGALACLVLSYFIKQIPFVFEFILWLLVINIHNKIYPTLTGGDYLLNQFLVFNCFFSKSTINNLGWQSSLVKCFHNFAVAAIIIQIMLVYLIAAISKLNDHDWLGGNAIIQVNEVAHYNMFSNATSTNHFMAYFINYLVLFYQLFFPVLVWIKKIKQPFVILGILMHLYIALVLGLVSFGIIMIIGYVFFWPLKKQAT